MAEGEMAGRNSHGDPDPSALTTQAILREIASLKELVFTRIDAMDKAMVLFNDNIVRVPTDVDKQVGNLHRLIDEQFNVVDRRFETTGEQFRGIQVQFSERDDRVSESATAATTAVNAALQAQKEAAGKSEQGTAEQLNQLRLLLQTAASGLGDKNDDLKERVTRIESFGIGTTAATTTHQVDRGFSTYVLFAVVSALIAAVALGVAILKP